MLAFILLFWVDILHFDQALRERGDIHLHFFRLKEKALFSFL